MQRNAHTTTSPHGPGRDVIAIVTADQILARRILSVLVRDGLEVAGGPTPASVPSVVLVAARGADAGAAVEAARREHPGGTILLVALDDDGRAVRDAVSAGAAGVVREVDLERGLGTAIAAATTGHVVVPLAVRELLTRPVLSPREKQVAGMIVLGFTNAEIAAKLHVAETTVKSHLTSIFRKLGVRSRAEASARILDPQGGLGVGVLSAAAAGLDVVDVS